MTGTSLDSSAERIIGRLPVAQGRRWAGIVVTAGLGIILLRLALAMPIGRSVWMPILMVAGLGALAVAWWMHGATRTVLILTPRELRDGTGRRLAFVDDIRRVDRGAFVPKPSQGFLLRLSRPGPRAWVPGVWWRLGRTVGVGGVTSARDAKDMAALIDILIAERDALAGDLTDRQP